MDKRVIDRKEKHIREPTQRKKNRNTDIKQIFKEIKRKKNITPHTNTRKLEAKLQNISRLCVPGTGC